MVVLCNLSCQISSGPPPCDGAPSSQQCSRQSEPCCGQLSCPTLQRGRGGEGEGEGERERERDREREKERGRGRGRGGEREMERGRGRGGEGE